MNLKFKHVLMGCISLGLIYFFAFKLPMRIDNELMAKDFSFGYPFPFMIQDFSPYYAAGDIYPWYQVYEPSVPIAEFVWWRFVVNFVIVFFVIEVIVFGLEELVFRSRIFIYRKFGMIGVVSRGVKFIYHKSRMDKLVSSLKRIFNANFVVLFFRKTWYNLRVKNKTKK